MCAWLSSLHEALEHKVPLLTGSLLQNLGDEDQRFGWTIQMATAALLSNAIKIQSVRSAANNSPIAPYQYTHMPITDLPHPNTANA
jgi:hypothetical protein